MKRYWITIAFVLTFLAVLMVIGLSLASIRPLWNDEIYTTLSSVEGMSYGDILLGKVKEGNNCPLFYLLQKHIVDRAEYHPPSLWYKGTAYWDGRDKKSQILLRLNPVFFMSLAIVIICRFFLKRYSILGAIYSLFLTLSSYMVWAYWAEARPYALWFFLTTAQILFALSFWQSNQRKAHFPVALSAIHILLALTSVFGVIQAVIVSALLWQSGFRRRGPYFFLWILPVLIGMFYYFQAPHYAFWFSLSPEQLFREAYSRSRVYIFLIFVLLYALGWLQRHFLQKEIIPLWPVKQEKFLLWLTLNMILFAVLVLAILKGQATSDHTGFAVSSRYFIFLTPFSIIATGIFTISLYRTFCQRLWLCIPVMGGIGYLVLHDAMKVWDALKGLYPALFAG